MLTAPQVQDPDRPRSRSSWRDRLELVVRVTGAAVAAGALTGALIAGVGTRLVMRLVTLQSDDAFRGIRTDDGARVGELTLGGTLSLIAFVAVTGVAGSLVYVAVRRWLPSAATARHASFAAAAAVISCSQIVHDDGVDFTVLGSPLLSAALFTLVIGAYGWATAALVDRLLRPDGAFRRCPLPWAAAPLLLTVPIGLIVVVIAGVAVATLAGSRDEVVAVVRSRAVGVVGSAVLAALTVAAIGALLRDLVAIA